MHIIYACVRVTATYVCLYVCICVFVYMHVYTHTVPQHMYAYVAVGCTQAHVCVHEHMCLCTPYSDTCIYVREYGLQST